MKKPVKIVLTSLSILIGLVIVAGLFVFLVFRHEMKTMHATATSQVVDGVFAIKDSGVNMYLVRGDSGYVAFDAGQHADVIIAQINSLEIDPAAVRAILLTHTDFDHIAAIPVMPHATVYISDAEERLLNGTTPRSPIMNNKLSCAHQLVTDNQEMEIDGVSIKCLLTPGHTPGSMCYLVNGEYLFVGDSMGLLDGKVVPFVKFFNMDTELQKASVKQLAGRSSARYIFTGHHGYTDNAPEAFHGIE
ncbi:MBL fold metallo-hydrolase [candidate division KSB1 bacterium]|nr:MBL fold metallo-hydrolase [candidate division KSB1 bacterium]